MIRQYIRRQKDEVKWTGLTLFGDRPLSAGHRVPRSTSTQQAGRAALSGSHLKASRGLAPTRCRSGSCAAGHATIGRSRNAIAFLDRTRPEAQIPRLEGRREARYLRQARADVV